MMKQILDRSLETLDTVNSACEEIQVVLRDQVEKTSNPNYQADFERDVVTLDNLKLIVMTVADDIRNERVGASTELLLRIAANDFKHKLAVIPEKKTLRKEIERQLKEVHKDVVKLKVSAR